MTPIVNGLEAEFEGEIAIVRLEVGAAANARLQTQYGLRGHPSFVVLDSQGEPTERFVGMQTAETLREALIRVRP